eukprot:gene1198-2330_t
MKRSVKTLFNSNLEGNFDTIPKSEISNSKKTLVNFISAASAVSVATLGGACAAVADEVKPKTKKPKVRETDSGVKYIELKKGDGPYPSDGDYVIINYTGFLSNGTVFDTTEVKGRKPLTFRFGRKQIIPGLEDVISSMQPGGERTCNIPSQLAYAEKGVCIANEGCLVPPNENLKYAVKLLRIAAGFN